MTDCKLSRDTKVTIRRKPVPTSTRAMKLGGKAKDVESFVDQLKNEGENVTVPATNNIMQSGYKAPAIKPDVDE